MTQKELQNIINRANSLIRNNISTDDSVTNDCINKGFFYEDDFKDCIEIMEIEWHKTSEGDFPKQTGNYLTVCKNKNKEDGIYLYEIVYYTGEEWDIRTNWEDIIAWREIPKYEE